MVACGCGWEEAAHEQADLAERAARLRTAAEDIYGEANNRDADGETVEWQKVADAIVRTIRAASTRQSLASAGESSTNRE